MDEPTRQPDEERSTSAGLFRYFEAATWLLVMSLCAMVADAQNVSWPSEPPPRPLPAREVKFPPYEVRTLANGMQVIAVLHHEQPAITMRLLVRTGSAHDPSDKAGTASLVASLLDQGTTSKSAQEVADAIDSIGGAMSTGSGSDLTFVDAVVMKDSFGVAMNLVADVVRNPAFAPDEIERQKEQTISTLQVNVNDPDYVASVLFERLVFGFHPYGVPGIGTPETLASVSREDLQEFHWRHFVPNNMILAIVGDTTRDEAFDTAERVFGSWPRSTVPALSAIDPPPPTRRIVVVDKPDSVQTEIRVGQLAIPRKHPDYLAFDLAVKILGGEGANRLHRVLRSERGLTYGASAETHARRQAGDYVAETDTRTETTGESLRLMVDEFSRLQRQRVSERELADAQAYLAGSFPLTIETPNQIASQILSSVVFELPLDELATFRERVQAVTPDDIQRVARAYIRPDRLSMVLVGDAQAFVPQLRAAGFTDFEVIPIQQLDLMSATLKRESPIAAADPAAAPAGADLPAWDLPAWARVAAYTRTGANVLAGAAQAAAGAGRAADTRARDLLNQVVMAKGGLETLKGVRTVVAEATTVLHTEPAVTTTTTTYVVYPDRFRVDARGDGIDVVQIFNAGNAWEKSPAGVRDAPPPMRQEFAASVRRDMIPLLIAAAEGALEIRTLPDVKDAGGAVLNVLEISGRDLKPVRLFVDPRGMVARQAYAAPGPENRPIEAEERFADYRSVDGVHVAFEAQLYHNDLRLLTRTLSKVTLNGPLEDTLFARPR